MYGEIFGFNRTAASFICWLLFLKVCWLFFSCVVAIGDLLLSSGIVQCSGFQIYNKAKNIRVCLMIFLGYLHFVAQSSSNYIYGDINFAL